MPGNSALPALSPPPHTREKSRTRKAVLTPFKHLLHLQARICSAKASLDLPSSTQSSLVCAQDELLCSQWSGYSSAFPNPWLNRNIMLLVKVRVLANQLCPILFSTPWTVAHQVPWFMGFSRQEYWSGFPSPEDLPDPRTEQVSCIGRQILNHLSHQESPKWPGTNRWPG